MLKIEQIIQTDLTFKQKFLGECLQELKNNISALELFENKKLKTGVGPNKFHFERILECNTNESDVVYWVDEKRIFQYRNQLNNIFYRYTYILNKDGI